jgi:predicted lipoprotein with Yx(FWY)xxD motif
VLSYDIHLNEFPSKGDSMRTRTIALFGALLSAAALAACGGGGNSSTNSGTLTPPISAPSTVPVSTGPTPSPAAQATPALLAQLLGAPGFTNPGGMTLYVFDHDLGSSSSTCFGGCAGVWPPLVAPSGAQAVTLFAAIARGDGTAQWDYNGRPLYTYVGDAKPGDVNGDGLNQFGGIWHVARPSASASSSTPAPSASTPTSGIGLYRIGIGSR